MILSILKFLHLVCGTTFFGITIAAFFYIAKSINQGDRSLIDYSLRASYFGDAIILLCIIIQFISAESLVSSGHFTLEVPWIFVAYLAFSLLILLWLINLIIKRFCLSKTVINFIKSYYLINIMMILIFVIIIHDAVTQSTWMDFLFRK